MGTIRPVRHGRTKGKLWGVSAMVSCAALGVALLAAGGGPASATNRAGSSKATTKSTSVTLTFLNYYTTKEVTTLKKVTIPAFEKLHPGIKVTSVIVPYTTLLKKYLAEAAAGNPPDVFRATIGWIPELAIDGTALRVTDLSWYKKDDIAKDALPGPLLTTEYKGAAYGLPLDTNTTALFWNKTDFKAAGISSPPTTVTQLVADAKKLTVPSKDQYGLGVTSATIWDVSPIIWSMGGSFTNATYTTASGYMNSAATKKAVTLLVDGYDHGHGYIGPDIVNTKGVTGEHEFPKGKYAMYIDGPWAVTTFAGDKFSNYGIEAMPRGAGGSHSPTGGEDLVISKGSHHLADAELFAQFLTEPATQLAQAKNGEMSAYSTDSAAEVAASPYLKVFAAALPTADVRAVTPYYPLLATAWKTAIEKILAGKVSVSTGLAEATQASNAALAGRG